MKIKGVIALKNHVLNIGIRILIVLQYLMILASLGFIVWLGVVIPNFTMFATKEHKAQCVEKVEHMESSVLVDYSRSMVNIISGTSYFLNRLFQIMLCYALLVMLICLCSSLFLRRVGCKKSSGVE